MKHPDDEALLELYYLPEDSGEVRQHLSSCSDCETRWEKLGNDLRSSSAFGVNPDALPDTFWIRQRHAIARRVRRGESVRRVRWIPAFAGLAAAVTVAAISLLLRHPAPAPVAPQRASAATAVANAPVTAVPTADTVVQEIQTAHDPWDSDQLRDFRGVVEWESWVSDGTSSQEGTL